MVINLVGKLNARIFEASNHTKNKIMEKVRVLVASNESCSKEQVLFTQDFETPAEDFFMSDVSISSDDIIECYWPHAFPMDFILERQ